MPHLSFLLQMGGFFMNLVFPITVDGSADWHHPPRIFSSPLFHNLVILLALPLQHRYGCKGWAFTLMCVIVFMCVCVCIYTMCVSVCTCVCMYICTCFVYAHMQKSKRAWHLVRVGHWVALKNQNKSRWGTEWHHDIKSQVATHGRFFWGVVRAVLVEEMIPAHPLPCMTRTWQINTVTHQINTAVSQDVPSSITALLALPDIRLIITTSVLQYSNIWLGNQASLLFSLPSTQSGIYLWIGAEFSGPQRSSLP